MSLVRKEPDQEQTVFQPLEVERPQADAAVRPKRARSGLPEGTLLNNIYEVRRFLARGGMGEVYEGVNVNTDERVAIKVMLPHLAADPKVQAMFRKEARILTELAHPALVRYRVLAHEPHLELFYIVTEFIDGKSLADLLPELRPSAAELGDLIRRLADGLGTAHALGAIHRDMSPDNVLLPQGRLADAKIIDFGIARESSLEHQTVIGDSFAGKIGYVAPEQFGDFGRRIGPWTDVYSLGLVGLALSNGRAPAMGATLVDAVDRRREGADLSTLPASLKPIFARMLAPDPSHRFQTMAEVMAALDALPTANTKQRRPRLARAAADVDPARAERSNTPIPARSEGASSKVWVLGVGFLAVLAAGAAGLTLLSGHRPSTPTPNATAVAPELKTAEPAAIPTVAQPVAAGGARAAAPENPTPAPKPGTAIVKPQAAATHSSLPYARLKTDGAVTQPATAPEIQAAPAPIITAVEQKTQEAAPAPRSPTAPGAAVEACYSAVGGGWNYLGYAGRESCVAQAFAACEVVNGRWGKTQLRRYDGKIEAKGGGLLSRWQTVAPSSCPSPTLPER